MPGSIPGSPTTPSPASTAPRRRAGLDALKLVASFMVVGLHLDAFHDVDPRLGWVAQNGLFRLAVPMFLVVSGYYLREAHVAGRHWRWLGRVAWLYLAWTAIYAALADVPRLVDPVGPSWASRLLLGWFHLWYLPAALGAGLLVIALATPRRAPPSPRALAWPAAAAFLAGVALQYGTNSGLLAAWGLDGLTGLAVRRNALLVGFPFLAAGYLIRWRGLGEARPLGSLATLAAAAVAALLAESLLNLALDPRQVFQDNLASLGIAAPLVVLVALRLPLSGGRGRALALAASGVYLVHPLVHGVLVRIAEPGPTAATLATFAGSLGVAAALAALDRGRGWLL